MRTTEFSQPDAILVRTPRPQCPLCAESDTQLVVALRNLPVHIGRLWDSKESAKTAPRGDVELTFCRCCGFVFNAAYDAKKLQFEPGYEYSLHHSPSHLAFLEATADRLVERYDLKNKDIVEVGCGSGFFLKLLCERGGNRGWGFDPAVDSRSEISAGEGSVTLIPEFYGEAQSDVPCDLLVSRSMFELVPKPVEFLRQMRRTLGDRTGARFYLDIPNTSYVFRHRASWNLFYEQCNYFVEETLVKAFQSSGFDVLDAGECLGEGYYLFVEAAPSDSGKSAWRRGDRLAIPSELTALADHHQQQLDHWRCCCESWRQEGKHVVAWGSGGRAINFLNLTAAGERIEHIVDINPARHGGFVSGSGQKNIAPEELASMQPDVVVITNNLYGDEIRQHVASLGIQCDFVEI